MCTSDRISVFGYVMLLIFMGGGICFLALTFLAGNEYVTKRRYCVQGAGPLVYPGPGAPATTYLQGPFTFHRSENTIDWHLYHNLSSPVTRIAVYGPVQETNPLQGQLYATLCEAGTTAPCLYKSAHSLSQRITETVDGTPLGDYVTEVTTRNALYIARVATANFPDGEVAFRFFSLC